jgi:biotin carboxylase
MKIALLQEERYLPSYHGSNKSNRCLLEALSSVGYDCRAFCAVLPVGQSYAHFRRDMSHRGIDVATTEADTISFVHNGVQVRGMPRHASPETRSAFLIDQLRQFRPDIILVSSSPHSYHLRSALSVAPARTIYIAHGHHDLPFGPQAETCDPARHALLRQVAAAIGVSMYGVEYLRRHGGIEAQLLRFPVYGNGPFAKLGSFDRGCITLTKSSVTKGVDIFLELAMCFPRHPFAASRWGAAADTLAALERLPNVAILEPADDIERLLSATKILLVPSVLPETFGLVVPEAMIRGIPVLASDLGGLAEATLNAGRLLPVRPAEFRQGAYVCPPQNLAPWCDALGRLLEDREAYELDARSARSAAAHFIASVGIRPFEDLFQAVCARDPSSRRKRRVVAVVDPYDAGYLLVKELARRGAASVGVAANQCTDPEISGKCDPRGLLATVRHRGSAAQTVASLRAHEVEAVLAGCETGVGLADELSERMNRCSNGMRMSAARRHKYLMAEAARRHGLAVPAQRCSSSLDELQAWARERGKWPVVVKPPESLASDGVRLCRSEAELASAFSTTVGRRNVAGLVNDGLIVQELLNATQYVVDTVSFEGRHYLSGIWRYGRPAFASDFLSALADNRAWPGSVRELGWKSLAYGAISSTSKEILPGEGRDAEILFDYAARVLDALDIVHGPCHFELMWTDDGVRLVEVGARVHGAPQTHLVSRMCIGISQAEQTVDLLLDPPRFLRQARRSYALRWRAMMVRLKVWKAGIFHALRGFDRITRLESFHDSFAMSPPGCPVPGCVGVVILLHPDEEALARDHQTIRSLEAGDLYDLELLPQARGDLVEHVC